MQKKSRCVQSCHVDHFFDSHGVVHHEYAPQGQDITKEYHLDGIRMTQMSQMIGLVGIVNKATLLWLLTNPYMIKTVLAKHTFPLVHQAVYSPVMVFGLFPKLNL